MVDDKSNSKAGYEKFISYLFSATTLHTVLGVSPVIAIGCGSQLEKLRLSVKKGIPNVKRKFILPQSTNTIIHIASQ